VSGHLWDGDPVAEAHYFRTGDWPAMNGSPPREVLREAKTIVRRKRPLKRAAPEGLIRLSDVKIRAVSWLWRDRIPGGKITILDGDPGLGKSTVAVDLSARVSRGDDMPDGMPSRGPQNVLIVSGEDDLEDTIAPRIHAAGADMDRIFAMALRTDDEGEVIPFTIPDDLARLRKHIVDAEIAMAWIDPLMAFMSEHVQSHNDASMRKALAPLTLVAQETGCAIVPIRHLNKDSKNSTAMYRGGGSIAISGAARSVLLVARIPGEPEDSDRRVMAQVKSNLARRAPSLEFEVSERPLDNNPDASVSIIEWIGESSFSANALLSKPKKKTAREVAAAFLTETLVAEPLPAADVEELAADAEISKTTLKRARTDLDVHAFGKRGSDGKVQNWWWHLPGERVAGCQLCMSAKSQEVE